VTSFAIFDIVSSMATLRDVARHVGLSVATVSRALSGHPHVDEGTRRRIHAAAREIGYQPNALARALRQSRTKTVGLIIPDILNDFYAESATVLQHELEQHGYRLILCISNSDPETDRSYLRTLVEHRVDAIVHVPCTPEGGLGATRPPKPIPVVELLRHSKRDDCDAVVTDDREGAAALTRHLTELGHRSIAMITGSAAFSTTRYRAQGYRDALHAAGIAPERARILYGDYSRSFGYEATLQLMRAASRPTAIFSSGSPLTLGVLSALKELRIAIPTDVSLVCYEDPEWYAAQDPPLTCYALPLREMGRVAAQLVVKRLSGSGGTDAPRVMRFPGRLVVRESTAPAPALTGSRGI
jgi:LacI family transcriptional regulator